MAVLPGMKEARSGAPRYGKVMVGLPAYNEARVLPALLSSLHETLSRSAGLHEILVVDDGSTDGTREVLETASRTLPVIAHHHAVNQNLGGAMRSLFRLALERGGPGDVLVCMDADNTFRADQVPELLRELQDGVDLVIASRYAPGGGTVGVPWRRRLLSLVANLMFRRLFPARGLSEYTCSFRCYRWDLLATAGRVLGEPWFREQGFACMPEILIRLLLLGPGIAEVPVKIRYDRKVGASKMKVLGNVRKTLALMRRLRRAARVNDPARELPAGPRATGPAPPGREAGLPARLPSPRPAPRR